MEDYTNAIFSAIDLTKSFINRTMNFNRWANGGATELLSVAAGKYGKVGDAISGAASVAVMKNDQRLADNYTQVENFENNFNKFIRKNFAETNRNLNESVVDTKISLTKGEGLFPQYTFTINLSYSNPEDPEDVVRFEDTMTLDTDFGKEFINGIEQSGLFKQKEKVEGSDKNNEVE